MHSFISHEFVLTLHFTVVNLCVFLHFPNATLMLFPGMRGSPLREVRPGEDGKLRLGGGGGGDLEGFSVRYRGTVSSSRRIKYLRHLQKDLKKHQT